MATEEKRTPAVSADPSTNLQIIPNSTDIQLSSTIGDQEVQNADVRDLQINANVRRTQQSSNLFRRLMSMDSMQAMSTRNLLFNNPVFRKRALSIAVNVMSRILTLAMNAMLLVLSTAFCVAQLSEVHLKLYKECEPKTLEEIYHHSYMAGLRENGSVEINAESQWGRTDDACYTTRSFEQNEDQLWTSNVYEHKWNTQIDHKVVLFGMASLYSLCVLMYNLVNLVRDIYHLKKNTVHTLADVSRGRSHDQTLEERPWSRLTTWLVQMMETEDTRWVLRCVLMEFMEFGVALSSMLLYNGYNWNDPKNEDDVYLAEKPHFIKMFAVGLAANMFGSAFLWMTYMAAPRTCHGLTFRTAFFFVEDLSDLFYTLFPIIVVYNDTYNANADELLVLLGQFRVDGFLAFWSRLFFLSFLCFKTHHLVYSSHRKLRNRYYSEFEQEDTQTNWIDEDDPEGKVKRCFLFIVSALYVISGISVLVLVSQHFSEAETHCNLIREAIFLVEGAPNPDLVLSEKQKSLLESNPELFLWDECLYQTFPFIEDEQQRCQCRVFAMDFWSDLDSAMMLKEELSDYEEYSYYYNYYQDVEWLGSLSHLGLSRNTIVTGMLENNIMLEKFRMEAGYEEDPEFLFTPMMFRSLHMKAFEWVWGVYGIGFGDSMASWTELDYLKIEVGYDFGAFQNFKELPNVKHLSIEYWDADYANLIGVPLISDENITTSLNAICFMESLQSLAIYYGRGSIPHCFGNLREMRFLDLGSKWGAATFTQKPLSILDLPKLETLDLFRGFVSWENLLSYNLPREIDRNDGIAVRSWMETHLSFNADADFYFQLNPICGEISSVFPEPLRELLKVSCDYGCSSATFYDSFCSPRTMADGFCNLECNTVNCNYDAGDCIQLCFAPELTSCSWDDLLNEECDAQCNNEYCSAYGTISGWNTMSESQQDPDSEYCSLQSVDSECQLSLVDSQFLDPLVSWDSDDVCEANWIGDGHCDDLCRTVECSFDEGDCEVVCVGVCWIMSVAWQNFDWDETPLWKAEHNWFCDRAWENAVAAMDDFEGSDDCHGTLQTLDFNEDENLNFREFAALMSGLSFGFEDSRHLQINCSSCMDYYGVPAEFYNL